MQPGVTKHHLLLVDGDPKSLRVLDVSLKKAGFQVTTATNGREAIAALESEAPDLVISDTHMPEVDGFELCRRIKQKPEWAGIPFLFLASRTSIEDKIRGLELGVEDYLTKPIYIKEITIRVRMALQRAQRERLESRRDGRTKFAGQLTDIGMVDLVQTIELNRKSGIIYIVNKDRRRGAVYFRDGKIIDAEAGRLSGAEALYRLFSWSEGSFEVEFKSIRRKDVIELSPQALLMEGMRRLDEWTRLLETMPPLDTVFEVDYHLLAERLSDLPDEVNGILRLFDGRRSLLQVIDDCDFPDLEALTVIGKLYGDKLIYETRREVQPDRPATSRLERWLSASEAGSEDAGEEPVGDERNRRITARYQAVPGGDDGLDAAVDPASEAAAAVPTADTSKSTDAAGAAEPAAAATSEDTAPSSPERPSDRSRPVTLVGWPLNEGEEATPPTVQVIEGPALREEPPLAVAAGAPAEDSNAVAGGDAPEPPADGSSPELLGGSSVDLLAGDSSPELLSGGLPPELSAEGGAPPAAPDADLAALLDVVNEALPNEPEPATATVQTESEQAAAPEPAAAPNVHEEVTVTRAPVPPSAASVNGDDVDELDLRPRRGRKMLVVAGLAAAAAAGLFAWKVKGVRTAPTPVEAAVEPAVPAAPPKVAEMPARAPEPAIPAVEMPKASPTARENAPETAAKTARESAPETPQPVEAPVAPAASSTAAPEVVDACRRAYADGNGRYKDVLGACRPAAESQPGNAELLVMLAHAELERGNTRAALSWAKKAVGADPERAEAHVFIGQAEQEAGNVAAAKAAYRRYLKLAPKGRYARDLRAILDTL